MLLSFAIILNLTRLDSTRLDSIRLDSMITVVYSTIHFIRCHSAMALLPVTYVCNPVMALWLLTEALELILLPLRLRFIHK